MTSSTKDDYVWIVHTEPSVSGLVRFGQVKVIRRTKKTIKVMPSAATGYLDTFRIDGWGTILFDDEALARAVAVQLLTDHIAQMSSRMEVLREQKEFYQKGGSDG